MRALPRTHRDCASFQPRGERVVRQIHEVQAARAGYEEARITCVLLRLFTVPISLATTLPNTKSSTYGISEVWAGDWSWQREEETASKRRCTRITRTRQFEDWLNSLVGWLIKLIGCLKIWTYWFGRFELNQFEDWLNSLVGWLIKLIGCLKIWTYWFGRFELNFEDQRVKLFYSLVLLPTLAKDAAVLWLALPQHSWDLDWTVRSTSVKVDCIELLLTVWNHIFSHEFRSHSTVQAALAANREAQEPQVIAQDFPLEFAGFFPREKSRKTREKSAAFRENSGKHSSLRNRWKSCHFQSQHQLR